MRERLIKALSYGNNKTALLIFSTFSIVLMGLAVLSWHLRINFWFELLISYLPQIIIINFSILLLISSLLIYRSIRSGWRSLLRAKRKHNLMAGLVVVLMLHSLFLPFTITTATRTSDYEGRTLNVMTINKLYSNSDLTQTVNYIQTVDPDILAVEEVFKNEAEELATRLGYSYWHMAACDCSAYGSDLALFSRFPIENTTLAFEDRLGGVLRSEIIVSHEENIIIYVTHIVPPYGSTAYSIRPDMLDQLSVLISEENSRVILMGDFNASLHSVDMREFASSVKSRVLPVANKPWPKCSWFLLSELFCARIDHIFVPIDSLILSEDIGPYIGSDHRPISVVLSY